MNRLTPSRITEIDWKALGILASLAWPLLMTPAWLQRQYLQKGESLKLNLGKAAFNSRLHSSPSSFRLPQKNHQLLIHSEWRPNPCSDQCQPCQTHQSHEAGIGMLLHKNIPSKTGKVTVWTNSRDNYRKCKENILVLFWSNSKKEKNLAKMGTVGITIRMFKAQFPSFTWSNWRNMSKISCS